MCIGLQTDLGVEMVVDIDCGRSDIEEPTETDGITSIKNDHSQQATVAEIVDIVYLNGLLRNAGYLNAKVLNLEHFLLDEDLYGGGRLHHFLLTLEKNQNNVIPTSLVLKETQYIPSQATDNDYVYREMYCYQNGLFGDLGTRLTVPKIYGLHSFESMQRSWIWMEDCSDAFAVIWTPELLIKALRDLAELHACWWGRETEFYRMSFLKHRGQAMYNGKWTSRIALNCSTAEKHPFKGKIGRVFTDDRCNLLLRLSEAVDLIYPQLERLPQTLLHQDIWLPNMGCYNSKTLLIDWAHMGPGTPGADLAFLYTTLVQTWGPDVDDESFLQALYAGLVDDWKLPMSFDQIVVGYELAFCLRPAHALGGPIFASILSGQPSIIGGEYNLDKYLKAAEQIFQRIERGLDRLN